MFITALACHIPDVMKCLRLQALCGSANYKLGVRTNCYLALSFLPEIATLDTEIATLDTAGRSVKVKELRYSA